MVANRELSEKQKEKIEKEINYMFPKSTKRTKNQSGRSSTPTTSIRAAIKANRSAK